jgi:predicted outer membrane protein
MKQPRTWILLGATMVLATSASAAAQTASGSGIRVSKDRTTSTSTVTSTTTTAVAGGDVNSVPAFSLSMYPTLTLTNIAAHMLSGDSLEIRLAQLAQTKATNQAVRDYATMLANDHAAHLSHIIDTYKDEDVVPAPLANDVEGVRLKQMISNLTAMAPGAAWDAAFVRFAVQQHQNEIDLLSANTNSVHGHEMHELMEDTIAALTKHRDAGKSTATTAGITLY